MAISVPVAPSALEVPKAKARANSTPVLAIRKAAQAEAASISDLARRVRLSQPSTLSMSSVKVNELLVDRGAREVISKPPVP